MREERLKTPLPKPAHGRSEDQSPAKSVVISPRFEATTALDEQFSALVFDIQHRLSLLARAPTIRVQKWLRKLHDPVSNVTWKRLRNDYARLLIHNLKRGVTNPPFDKAPGDGPLRNLAPDEKASFRGDGCAISRAFPGQRVADENDGGGNRRTTGAVAKSSKMFFDRRHASSTERDTAEAESALRDLLRRAEVAGAPKAYGREDEDEASRSARTGRRAFHEILSGNVFFRDDDRGGDALNRSTSEATGAVSRENESEIVPRETRPFLANDGADSGDGGKPSRCAPEDALGMLGAEREKSKELEWRLRRSEEALERCRAELRVTVTNANAARESKAEEIRELRASHRRELDGLIRDFETRRLEVRGSRAKRGSWTTGIDVPRLDVRGLESGISKARSPLRSEAFRPRSGDDFQTRVEREKRAEPEEKETDFFSRLEAFQRNTSELRKRVSSEARISFQ